MLMYRNRKLQLCHAALFVSFIAFLLVPARTFAAVAQITDVSPGGSGLTVAMLGKPAMTTDHFFRDGTTYIILSFNDAILDGSARLLHLHPSATVVASQYSVNPDVVHIVVKDHRKTQFHIRTSAQENGRFLVSLDFRAEAPLKVFLDVGHGGYDPGGVGPAGLPESVVNLAVAKRLEQLLVEKGISVELDRTDNAYVSLRKRVALADASGANLFLGLYCNASADHAIHGTTTYYYHTNAYNFASYLEKHVSSALGLSDNGVMQDNLYVIRHTTPQMPDVLIEYAYISNYHEEKLLATTSFRDRIAAALADAIIGYYANRLKKAASGEPARGASPPGGPVWITSIFARNGQLQIVSDGSPVLQSSSLVVNGVSYFVVTIENAILAGEGRTVYIGPPFSGQVTITQYTVNPNVVRIAVREDYPNYYRAAMNVDGGSRTMTTIFPVP